MVLNVWVEEGWFLFVKVCYVMGVKLVGFLQYVFYMEFQVCFYVSEVQEGFQKFKVVRVGVYVLEEVGFCEVGLWRCKGFIKILELEFFEVFQDFLNWFGILVFYSLCQV